jgi:hypothetical protein
MPESRTTSRRDAPTERGNDLTYLREAFNVQYNWIALAGAAGFAILSASALPLVMAAGLELIYLGLVPQNSRFRRLVRSRMVNRQKEKTEERRRALLERLTPDRRSRFKRVETICEGIRENHRQLSVSSQILTNQMEERLDGLTQAFLRLLIAAQQHGDYIMNFRAEAVQRELDEIQKSLEKEPENIQAISRKRIEILNKRLEKLKKIRENLQLIDVQSAAIEDVLNLIRDQSITMRDPQEVSNQLDSLVRDVEQTEETVREVESLFDSPVSPDLDAFTMSGDLLRAGESSSGPPPTRRKVKI